MKVLASIAALLVASTQATLYYEPRNAHCGFGKVKLYFLDPRGRTCHEKCVPALPNAVEIENHWPSNHHAKLAPNDEPVC